MGDGEGAAKIEVAMPFFHLKLYPCHGGLSRHFAHGPAAAPDDLEHTGPCRYIELILLHVQIMNSPLLFFFRVGTNSSIIAIGPWLGDINVTLLTVE